MRKNLDQLGPAELCGEVRRIQEEMEKSSRDLAKAYETLYSSVRHREPDEMTFAYLSVSNSGKRLVALLQQALKRSSLIELKVVSQAKKEIEDRDRRKLEAAQRDERAKKEAARKAVPKMDPLEALFGVSRPLPEEYAPVDSRTLQSDINDLYGEDET